MISAVSWRLALEMFSQIWDNFVQKYIYLLTLFTIIY